LWGLAFCLWRAVGASQALHDGRHVVRASGLLAFWLAMLVLGLGLSARRFRRILQSRVKGRTDAP